MPVGLVAFAIEGCSKEDTPGATAPDAASSSDASESDSSSQDGGVDPKTDAAAASDAGGVGATCSFNHDCQTALRCECDETTGCACKPGARGTGKNGIDPCTSGNNCASALCVEGPADSGSFCSDECMTIAQCTGKLPVCSDIAGVGRVCIRMP